MKYILTTLTAVTLIIAASVFVPVAPARADSPPTCVYLRDTGHNLQGPFLTFYSSHNGYENFGVPLTEAFLEDGFIVQYFQRGRFEFHADNPEPFRVQLGLLGMQYGVNDPPIKSAAIPPANNPNFRYFPDTGLMISFTIKQYFDSHGGIDVLGYPLSLIRYESGNFVQYFQRARLEWNPADSDPSKVRPTPIGQVTLDKRYGPDLIWRARAANDWCPEYDAASLPPGIVPPAPPLTVLPTPVPPGTVLNLQVRVKFRQTGPTGPQYVDVTVTDQNGRPFAGAALFATIRFANGDRVIPVMSSDASGKSTFSFDIGTQPVGSTTLVDVTAVSSTLSATGRDSFTR
jgi:hypothetical protein